MKKIIYFAIVFLSFFTLNISADTLSLDDIAKSFNDSSYVKSLTDTNSSCNAVVKNKELQISFKSDDMDVNLIYKLNGDILSGDFSDDLLFTGSYISMQLIDSIQVLHGYKENEIMSTLNYDYENLSLEKDNVEFNYGDNSFNVKVNINEKIPLADFSEVYITVEDLEDLKDYLVEDGSAQLSRGNVIFYKDDEQILIGEKDNLTDNSYKSLLSVIEVMFDSNVYDYFVSNYKELSSSDKSFSGFDIKTSVSEDEISESFYNDSYKYIKVIYDRDKAVAASKSNYNIYIYGGIVCLIAALLLAFFKIKK